MKNFKLAFIITFLFALHSNKAVAQDNNRKEEMIEQMKMAKERLSLSEQQEFTYLAYYYHYFLFLLVLLHTS